MGQNNCAKLHGKKAISGVQNCTEKKRSQVCKIARKKSGIKCAKERAIKIEKLHGDFNIIFIYSISNNRCKGI